MGGRDNRREEGEVVGRGVVDACGGWAQGLGVAAERRATQDWHEHHMNGVERLTGRCG